MSVTTPILDILLIDTHSLSTIAVADNSQYPIGFTVVSPTLEIIPPSFPISTKTFSNGNLNIYNSNDVGISCNDNGCDICELPDGYWSLKYSISPAQTYFVNKNFMRTAQIQKKLSEAFLALNLDKCDETIAEQDMRKLDQIQYYIQTSISAGNNCNPKLAIDLYNIANRSLKEFTSHKCFGRGDLPAF